MKITELPSTNVPVVSDFFIVSNASDGTRKISLHMLMKPNSKIYTLPESGNQVSCHKNHLGSYQVNVIVPVATTAFIKETDRNRYLLAQELSFFDTIVGSYQTITLHGTVNGELHNGVVARIELLASKKLCITPISVGGLYTEFHDIYATITGMWDFTV